MNCTSVPSDIRSFYLPDGPPILASLWKKAHAGSLERLDPAECINAYATSIQSKRRNVLLVASDSKFPSPAENHFINASRVYWAANFQASYAQWPATASDAYDWICSGLDKPTCPGGLCADIEPCSKAVRAIRNADLALWRVGGCKGTTSTTRYCELARFPVEYCLSEQALPHCKLHFEPNIAIVIILLNVCKFKALDLFELRTRCSLQDYTCQLE
jgi:hypothetical protein